LLVILNERFCEVKDLVGCAMRRALCDATNARLVRLLFRFITNVSHFSRFLLPAADLVY
jgi:hypothetical protein